MIHHATFMILTMLAFAWCTRATKGPLFLPHTFPSCHAMTYAKVPISCAFSAAGAALAQVFL